ncbi:MAG: hypothetical protein QXE96_01755 [Candidatus Caldarchaeum sp.]
MSELVEDKGFWRDFASTAAFFSPAVSPLQREFGVSSKDLMRKIGEEFGRKASESIPEKELLASLNHLSEVWRKHSVGRLEVITEETLTIRISDCIICGQIPELGKFFECSFHEGFLNGFLSHRLKTPVKVWQERGEPGQGGTWTRTFKTDIKL